MNKIKIVIFAIIFLSFSCKEKNKSTENISQFDYDIICSPEPMPKYDGNKVTLLDDNQNQIKDTIISEIEKRRDIFKPCRHMIYRAIWRSKSGEIITNSRIKMMATGLRWDVQPEKQDEILIQVEFSERDKEQTKRHQLNKGILERRWMEQGIEGVIENVEEIWMHPFRFNQFNFTEVAPFPEIKFPLKIGKTWSGQLRIMDGWGDWTNTSGSFEYEVVAQETINIKYGSIDNCWHIISKSEYPFGNSTFEYWFNESLGFVKKEYKNYGNQTLSIELEEIKENSM